MPLRVLFLAANPVWTAIESTHANLLRSFDRSQVEGFVAASDRPFAGASSTVAERFAAIPGVRVKALDFGPSLHGVTRPGRLEMALRAPRIPAALARLAAHVVLHGIDVIHFSQKPYDATFGVLLAKMTRRASVLHMHVKHGSWFTRPVRMAVEQADLVLGVSRFVADSCVAGGVPAEKVRHVHNGFDSGGWRADGDGARIRRELGMSDDAPLLLCVGRLTQWKGQWRAIDALPAIRVEHPDARLVLVGEEDPWGHGGAGYRAELEARARSLKVAGAVTFAGFRRDVPDLLAAADLFVFPSWEEPFGMVFVEAMASRKPVVALASGGALEIIEPGETGLLIDAEAPNALSRAIIDLLGDSERRRRMGEAGRERVARLFAPSDKAREVVAVYHEAMARSRG
jgi:glycosyltransferase involved in cell wall biosynthesis